MSNWSIDWLTDYVGVCSERCPAGHWSPTGLQPCDACPSGSYRNESGSTTCVVCPAHSPHTLPYSTAVSAAHCFSQCSLALSHIFIDQIESSLFPSVLWHCWLGDRKGIQPVKNWVLVCWWRWFDWNFARLIAPVVTTTSITLSSNKIQNGVILVPASPGPPGKWPLKRRDNVTK